MNTFSSQCAATAAPPPDPRKHVNYVLGMVLGADDLEQEFVYHQHQRRWLARDAIGYGTLTGLLVEVQARPERNKGPEVMVSPGTALTPRGHLIRVAPQQCAALNEWLKRPETLAELKLRSIADNGTFTAYVVLCFRDCKVDEQPVPGEPCRCESETKAPSRIMDDFRLELRFTPPAQREEDAIRDFVQWLRRIKTTNAESGYSTIEVFLDELRAAARDLKSPLESPPDFLYGSPPESLVIPCCHLCEYLRAALRLWVTELRPLWQAQWAEHLGGGCGCHGPERTEDKDAEECLLLAALTIPLTNGQVADAKQVGVDDSRRPFVVHLRMLQEWLLCGRGRPCCNERTFATVFALDDHTLRLWVHHPLPVHLDESAVALLVDDQPVGGFTVTPVLTAADPSAAVPHNVFDLDLGASPPTPLRHQQRIALQFDTRLIVEQTSPVRTLAEAIRHGCWCYTDLAEEVAHVFSVVDLPALTQTLAGDVTGPLATNTVEQIRNIPVNLAGLGDAAVLGFDSARNEWSPIPPRSLPVLPATQTFGASGDAGVAREYARADHVHPMADLPTIPGPNVDPSAVESGTAANRGTNPTGFALADHVHPLVDPVPAHDTTATAHRNLEVIGDVTGTPAGTVVMGLRGIPIAAPPSPLTNDFTLITNGGRLVWGPRSTTPVVPFRVTSGLIHFLDVGASERRFTPEIDHGHRDQLVMIRLGLERDQRTGPTLHEENMDTLPGFAEFLPRFVVLNVRRSPTFRVVLADARPVNEDQPRLTWSVRWWAVPVTDDLGEIEVPPGFDELPREVVLSHIPPGGILRRTLATNLGVTVDRLGPALEALNEERLIRIEGARIMSR